ncbi:MAG TPA: cupin-like domain-containing protein [Candidatus Binatia bacterium]|nr:cupin-like domain-containing protein [Candidatus Binatia bacterium]
MQRELTLRDLKLAGRSAYLAHYFADHFLGHERSERYFGAARRRNRARMQRYFEDWPTDQRRPVPVVAFTSHAEFYRTHAPWEPAVFRGLARNWRAVDKWDLDFFAREWGNTPAVLIDQVGLYGDGEHSRRVVQDLGTLIDSIRAGKRECLRFLPFIDDNPALKTDLDMPFFSGFRSRFSLREFTQLFIAPAGTRTPVHCAHESNAFVQVHGRKRWLLWPARYQQLIEPEPDRRPYFHSEYDPAHRSEAFPLGPYAPAYEIVLDPGDVLYVPPFVWHYVENLTTTIAVAYRFFSIRHGLGSSKAMMLLKLLATRPSLFHGLVCPRRSLERRCRVDGCPFAIPEAIAEAA